MKKGKTEESYLTSKLERFNYSFYFLGQGMTYVMCYSFLQQYALDAGISALLFAGVAFAIKAWDAVNDPIFGILLEKITSKVASFCLGFASLFWRFRFRQFLYLLSPAAYLSV